jgi:hypothetical protein
VPLCVCLLSWRGRRTSKICATSNLASRRNGHCMIDISRYEHKFNGDSFTLAIQTFPLLMLCPFVHFPTPLSKTTSYIIQIIVQHLCKSRQPGPPLSSHLDTLPSIQLWPHIEVEAWPALAIRSSRVKVNHVVDSRTASIDNPIVAIKRRRIAKDSIQASSGCHSLHLVGKGFELRTVAS